MIRGRRDAIGTAVAGTLLVGSLAFAAFQSDGFRSDHLTLHDNGVWISRASGGTVDIGRVNYDLQKVDSKSPQGVFGVITDVHQSGPIVVVETPDLLFGYDVALNRPLGKGSPKPADAQISLGGENGAYLDPTGERFWFTDKSAVQAIELSPDKVTDGSVTLTGATRTIVGVDGTAHVVAPDSAVVWAFPEPWGAGTETPDVAAAPAGSAPTADTTATTQAPPDTAAEAAGPTDPTLLAGRALEGVQLDAATLQMTTVGAGLVLLSGRTLITDDVRSWELPTEIGADPVLQLPGPDANGVLVASSNGLARIDLSSGAAEVVYENAAGSAIAPVWLGGCSYGAWADLVYASCADEQTKARSSTSTARFRVNRDRVVLNYADGSSEIFVDGQIRALDNQWSDAFDPNEQTETEESDEQQEEDNECVRPVANTAPEVPSGSTFSVRQGRSTRIDVLNPPGGSGANDPDCDVLTVTLPADSPLAASLRVIDDGRALQYTPAPDASGNVAFDYIVSDGVNDVQAGASITVIGVDDPGSAPTGVVDRTSVEVGKTVVIDVLTNDFDPEGDALTVTSATLPSASDGTLVWQSSGRFAYTAPGSGVGTKIVQYTIRDASGNDAQATVEISVISAGVPAKPTTRSDSVIGMLSADTSAPNKFSVNVLANDSDPNGDTLRLTSVSGYPDEPFRAEFAEDGTVTINPDRAGRFNYEYEIVDDGQVSAKGRVRFEILENTGAAQPVAVTDGATVSTERPVVIDVLANDTDLNGDLLMVSQTDLPDDVRSDLNVEVIERRLIRVSAKSSSLSRGAYSFNYTVSDGSGNSTTTVNLGVASPANQQPPVALEDRARVHLGGYVTVPVLSNDFDPNGIPLSVVGVEIDEKVAEFGEPGVAFVQGNQIRYLPPTVEQRPSAFTATGTYRVFNGRDITSGRFTIQVTDPNENAAPNPTPLEIRTVEGVEVAIPIPSVGLDPDGDQVELIAQEVPLPLLGTAAKSDLGDSLVYTPIEGKTGPDSFRWLLRDSYGATGYLTVRVVVGPRPSGNRPPVAVPDSISVEVGKTTAIPVVENDTDPDNDALVLDTERPFDQPNAGNGTVAAVDGGRFVAYTAPATEGDYAFLYYVTDGNSAPVPGLVRVSATTRDKIVNRPPVVKDAVLKPFRTDEVVSVDLTTLASDPEGQAVTFTVGADAVGLGAAVDEQGVVSVKMTPTPLQFTFVAQDELGAQSLGVIRVPVPQNQAPTVAPQRVEVGEDQATIEIAIDESAFSDPDGDPVVIRQETSPVLDDPNASGGGDMNWNGNSFVFNRNPDFGGEAKITYYIEDRPASGQPPIQTPAYVILDIKKKVNVPPVVGTDSLDLASGTEVTYDLGRLVTDEDLEPGATLEFSGVSFSGVDGVSLTSNGASITITATDTAVKEGESPKNGTVAFTVSDGEEGGIVEGTLNVVVRQTDIAKPQAVDDQFPAVKQGQSGSWNLLTNDPPNGSDGYKIRLVTTTAATLGSVEVVSETTVKFTPSPDVSGPASFTYTIYDNFEREATATVRYSVEDRPDKPTQPTVGEMLSKTAVVSFARPDDNGSPITGFEVKSTPGGTTPCDGTTCTVSGLTNGQEYTFQVRAQNGVDWSDWSDASAPYEPNELPQQPPTPQLDWNDQSLTVTWNKIPNEGSEILGVKVLVSPSGVTVPEQAGGGNGGTVTIPGVTNGTSYTVTLIARNKLGDSPSSPQSASVVPAGPPSFTGAPTLAAYNGFLKVNWPAASGNGDSALTYTVKLSDLTSGGTTSTNVGNVLNKQLPAVNGHQYRAVINVSNKYSVRYAPAGADSSQSNVDTAVGPPGAPAAPTATAGNGTGAIAVSWSAPADNGGGAITSYELNVNNTGWTSVGNVLSVNKTGLTLGQSYTFQVRARNNNKAGAGDTNQPGTSSTSSAAAIPYTAPAQPSVSCNAAGLTITCNWSVGALNGPTPQSVTVLIDGAGHSNAASGTWSGNVPYSTTRTMSVEVCNAGTRPYSCNSRSASATSINPPQPSVSIGWGGSAVGQPGCSSASCKFINVSVADLAGLYRLECWTNDTAPFYLYYSANDLNAGQLSRCYFGYPGKQVYVKVSGTNAVGQSVQVQSNTITN